VPLYEYECKKCGRRTERIENFAGPHLRKCPHCKGAVRRLPSAPAVQFRGSGFYATDYPSKSAAPAGEKSEKSATEGAAPTADAKPADARSADTKSADSSAKDKKPAKKKQD
jgi:putative FmdB family regulatory protein